MSKKVRRLCRVENWKIGRFVDWEIGRFRGPWFSTSEFTQNRLQNRQHHARAFGADDRVPQRLEFLPSCRVAKVPEACDQIAVGGSAASNRAPSVKVAVRPVVSVLELGCGHARWTEDGVPRVIKIPVVGCDPLLMDHAPIDRGSG